MLLGVLTIGFGVLCWRIARHARRANRARSTVVAAGVGGVAILSACLLLSTFRHFGGNTEVGDGGSAYACEAWWYQLGTPGGATDGDDQPSPFCRRAAIDAITPVTA